MLKNIIFDWGDTVMRDYPENDGPMYLWPHVEVIPFIVNTLVALNKYKLIIATNAGFSDTAAMIAALERVNVHHFFDGFFSSKELGVKKPNPQFFSEVCRRSLLVPAETVFVGNDYEKDMIGAKNAGLKTIFFNENTTECDFPAADLIILSMRDLFSAVETLQKED